MKNRKLIFAILAFAVIIAAAVVLIIFYPSSNEVDNAEGSMSIICPVHVYKAGDIMKSPCMMRPTEHCTFFDDNNCEYHLENAGTEIIQKGQSVAVLRERIDGIVQFVEVHVPR